MRTKKADVLYTLTCAALVKAAGKGPSLLTFLMSRNPPVPMADMPQPAGQTRQYSFSPPDQNSLAPETALPTGSVEAGTNAAMR